MTAEQPTIRKGQRKPYVKARHRQVEERIRAAAWLADYLDYEPSLFYEFFREVFDIEPRQTARYLARARAHEGREAGFSGGCAVSTN